MNDSVVIVMIVTLLILMIIFVISVVKEPPTDNKECEEERIKLIEKQDKDVEIDN